MSNPRAHTQAEVAFWLKFGNTIHKPDDCATDPVCVVHNPTDHHMRDWRLNWRGDRGIVERICPHGIGHPDPDQFEYWRSLGREYEAVHGCDGCCEMAYGYQTPPYIAPHEGW